MPGIPMTAAGIAGGPLSFAAIGDPLSSPTKTYYITGVTRDVNSNPLGHCIVILFRTIGNSIAAIVVSDASGNYSIAATPALQQYAVAYLAGTPDVAGTTVNTLVGV